MCVAWAVLAFAKPLAAAPWEVSATAAKVWGIGNESNCGLLGCVSAPAFSVRGGRELGLGVSLGLGGVVFAGPRGEDICFSGCDGRSLRGYAGWVDAAYVIDAPATSREGFLRPRLRAGVGIGHLRYLDAQRSVYVYEGTSPLLDFGVGLRFGFPSGLLVDLSGRWTQWLSLPSSNPRVTGAAPQTRGVGLPGLAVEFGWSI
jgi:hypothetical protein